MLCSRACVLLSPRDLVPSCSHEFMLSGSPTVMPSCYRASKLSYRKDSGNALLFFLWLSCLVCSDSLPGSLFTPSESILALSNHSLIFSYCHSVIVSCSHTPTLMPSCSFVFLLPGSRALVRLCPDGLKISCVHDLKLSCSHCLVLSCSHAVIRLQILL